MGTQEIQASWTDEQQRAFLRRLLNDLRALERMIEEGKFEEGVRKIGAEQELVLVDRAWDPAPVAVEVLARINDDRVTTELAKYNLEVNLDPLPLSGSCLSQLENNLKDGVKLVREAAIRSGAQPLLTGILPTLSTGDLCSDNITPRDRYYALEESISKARGGSYELRIHGADDLTIDHDSVMLESLNTSYQIHYQCSPSEFAMLHNIAQLITAPTLAAAVNSPILFGKRLWRETRIAIFQQTVDTRGKTPDERDVLYRCRFGEDWTNDSVLENFRSDIARFRLLFIDDSDEDPFEILDRGEIPSLRSLQTHNSTIYRWNRACYGAGAIPHLRIENRVLPAGPSIVDEVANSALWFGLMAAGPELFGDVRKKLDFDEARSNFAASAREGLEAHIEWLDGGSYTASDLLQQELIPAARQGLKSLDVDAGDTDRYLDIIEERVKSRQTGARWILQSAAAMKGQSTRAERLATITAGIAQGQRSGAPVHTWPIATMDKGIDWRQNYVRIGQYMTTDLLTVRENDPLDLVASIMDWERIRHVLVEDDDRRLVGIVSYRKLMRLITGELTGNSKDSVNGAAGDPIPVRAIMQADPVSVSPDTHTLDAIELMKEKNVSALPVVKDGMLVGIVSERDYMRIAAQLLERSLRKPEDSKP